MTENSVAEKIRELFDEAYSDGLDNCFRASKEDYGGAERFRQLTEDVVFEACQAERMGARAVINDLLKEMSRGVGSNNTGDDNDNLIIKIKDFERIKKKYLG
jgi:hypothetical protein